MANNKFKKELKLNLAEVLDKKKLKKVVDLTMELLDIYHFREEQIYEKGGYGNW